jgi:hypothetical protein
LCAAFAFAGVAIAEPASQTFTNPANTGTTGMFTVPAGVTVVHVVAVGGKGGDKPKPVFGPGGLGGFGGSVSGDLPVLPGQTLLVYVAGNGESAHADGSAAAGGFNGGGKSGSGAGLGEGGAGGGGGASDVRSTSALGTRLFVAAGGGGASNNAGGTGLYSGNGGAAGQPGTTPNEPGITAAGPGVANPDGTGGGGKAGVGPVGHEGSPGELGVGGAGGMDTVYDGGGGGGGLFGGGGGGPTFGQPGAGGASWITPLAANPSTTIDSTGVPRVTIGYILPTPPPSGTQPPSTNGSGEVPSITGLGLSSSVFRAASSGGSIAAKRTPPTGTIVSYTESLAAATTFSVLQSQRGVRSGRRCAKSPRHSHGRVKRCTRSVVVGTFSHGDSVGINRFRFTGRIGGHKLKAGTYRLRAVPRANQKNGQAHTVRFRIVA